MTTIAVIPARGGSRRIPRKNIQDFHGKPIIAYSIEKAKESGLFDRVIVSTDDSVIADVARKYGAEVWIRDPAYGDNDVGTQAVTAECLIGVGAMEGDIACCIYATAPLMDVKDLKRGYEVVADSTCIYAFSVGYPPLRDAAQFYWGFVRYFVLEEPLVEPLTGLIHIPDERVCDINTWDDWNRALKMYEELQK